MKNADYEKINQELVAIIQAGGRKGERAKAELLRVNTFLIKKIVGALSEISCYEDNHQVAQIALCKAAENYNPSSVTFGSYASWRICNAVIDEVRKHNALVHKDHRIRAKEISAEFCNDLFDASQFTKIKGDYENFDDFEKYGGEIDLGYTDDNPDALEFLCEIETYENINARMEELQPNIKEVLTRRFVNGEKLNEIAKSKGVSPQAIFGLQKEGVKMLKKIKLSL